jgi:hypothetical protein
MVMHSFLSRPFCQRRDGAIFSTCYSGAKQLDASGNHDDGLLSVMHYVDVIGISGLKALKTHNLPK